MAPPARRGSPLAEEVHAHLVDRRLPVALALGIDREPRDETRAAALVHPYWAGMYALHVDRAARDDTRVAATRTVDGAVFYAREIDLAVDDDLPVRMATKKDWWDAPTIAGFVDRVRSLGASCRGGSAEAGPARVATRDLPPLAAVPRYREVAKGPIVPVTDELRDDVEAMTTHGFAWLDLDATASPSAVVDAVHAAVREIQSGGHAPREEGPPREHHRPHVQHDRRGGPSSAREGEGCLHRVRAGSGPREAELTTPWRRRSRRARRRLRRPALGRGALSLTTSAPSRYVVSRGRA